MVERVSSLSRVDRLERAGAVALDAAYGVADRSHGIAMTTANQLGMASGSKTFTASVVLRLVDRQSCPSCRFVDLAAQLAHRVTVPASQAGATIKEAKRFEPRHSGR